jgi:hypothetical protein
LTGHKKLILGLVALVVIGIGTFAYGYAKRIAWDNDYLRVLQTVPDQEQLKEYERLLKSAPTEDRPYLRRVIASQYLRSGDYAGDQEENAKALEEFRQSGDIGNQIATLFSLAVSARAKNQVAEAEQYIRQALMLLGANDEIPGHSMPLYRLRLFDYLPSTRKSEFLCLLAKIKEESGHAEEAEALYKQALLTHGNFEHILACQQYSEFLKKHHREKEASAMVSEAENSIQVKHTGGKDDYFDDSSLAMSSLAYHQESTGNLAEALRLYRRCEAITAKQKGLHSDDHISTLVSIGKCLDKMGNDKEAEATLKEAYKLAKQPASAPTDPQHTLDVRLQHWCIIHASEALADFHFRKKNFVEAEKLYREACQLMADHAEDVPVSMQHYDWTQVELADCLLSEGKTAEAGSIYTNAIEALKTDQTVGHRYRFKTLDGYSRYLKAQGKTTQAQEYAKQAKQYADKAAKP